MEIGEIGDIREIGEIGVIGETGEIGEIGEIGAECWMPRKFGPSDSVGSPKLYELGFIGSGRGWKLGALT